MMNPVCDIKSEFWQEHAIGRARNGYSEYDLSPIKEDMFFLLKMMPCEVPFLRKAIVDGKIDGTAYYGRCCCLVGTLCKAIGVTLDQCHSLPVSEESLREMWFLPIEPGQTPENNVVCKITLGWIDEFLAKLEGK